MPENASFWTATRASSTVRRARHAVFSRASLASVHTHTTRRSSTKNITTPTVALTRRQATRKGHHTPVDDHPSLPPSNARRPLSRESRPSPGAPPSPDHRIAPVLPTHRLAGQEGQEEAEEEEWGLGRRDRTQSPVSQTSAGKEPQRQKDQGAWRRRGRWPSTSWCVLEDRRGARRRERGLGGGVDPPCENNNEETLGSRARRIDASAPRPSAHRAARRGHGAPIGVARDGRNALPRTAPCARAPVDARANNRPPEEKKTAAPRAKKKHPPPYNRPPLTRPAKTPPPKKKNPPPPR